MSHTIRNVEICRLLEQGVPIAEIARQFNLSESTVKKMKYTVCKELEVSPREAMSVAKNVEEKVRELEQVVTELKIGFDLGDYLPSRLNGLYGLLDLGDHLRRNWVLRPRTRLQVDEPHPEVDCG